MSRALALAACLLLPGIAWARDEAPPPEPAPTEDRRPVLKTPLLVAGGLLTAVGVGVIWVSSDDNSFRQPPLRDPTIVAGVAMIGVGVGLVTVGMVIDANGDPIPGVQVRF